MAAPCPLRRHAWVETKFRLRPLRSGSNSFRFCSRACLKFRDHRNGRRIHGTSFFRVQLRPRVALPSPQGRISLQVISCCSLQYIGTKLVPKNFLSAAIRDNHESECPPASTVHYCTLDRIMLFLCYRAFPSSAGLGQSSSLQEKSESGKSCVQREIVP